MGCVSPWASVSQLLDDPAHFDKSSWLSSSQLRELEIIGGAAHIVRVPSFLPRDLRIGFHDLAIFLSLLR